ncbi:DNA polymerase III subunit epsilon [Veronia nyctiphanis]|uniref:DNA polymerase III subunit epsilon n=1 Tax=Veronia nyctiphanis TaxID=1278244 RepID=A0A4Q0YSD5_9GAMM|nr:3'-5' exonuclease [Veronia nyctiphanis]RXJ73585.1 DNA polymerase III subunit epsilon [Veronia nyctiphanis]
MLYLGSDERVSGGPRGPDWQLINKRLGQNAKDPRLKRFYQAGVIDGATNLSDVEFVALDFETTGLEPSQSDIVSIGLVPFTLSRIYCKQARHWIVNPRKPLGEESVVIHGITHSDIEEAPDLKGILEEVLEALAGKMVVVHYRRIERNFFDQALKHRIGEGVLFPVVDTLDIESRFHRRPYHKVMSWLTRKPMTSIRLADSRTRYKLPFYRGHNALTDAIATAELLQAQVAHRYSPVHPIRGLWC